MTEVIPFDTDYFAFQEGGSKASGFLQALAVEKEDYLGALNKEQLNILGDELGVEKRSVRPDKGDKYQRKNHSRLAIRDWVFEGFLNPYEELKRVIKRLFPDVEPLRPFAGMEMKVSKKNPRIMSEGVLNYVEPTELTENYKDYYIQNEDDPAFKYSNPTTIWTDLTTPVIYDILMVLSPKSSLDTASSWDTALRKEFDLGRRLNGKIIAQANGKYYNPQGKQMKIIPIQWKFSPGEKRKIKDKVKQIITDTSVPEKTRDAIINILKSRKYDAFKNPGGIQELDEEKIRENMTKRKEKEERDEEEKEERNQRKVERKREAEKRAKEFREYRRVVYEEKKRLAPEIERRRKEEDKLKELVMDAEEWDRQEREEYRQRMIRLSKEREKEKEEAEKRRKQEEDFILAQLDEDEGEEMEEYVKRMTRGLDAEIEAERQKREKSGKQIKRGRGIPPEKAFFDGAVASYEKKAPNYLDGFQLIMDTPTFDAYLRQSDKTILLTSRGTEITSWGDLKADASLLANNLKNTNRYNQDANLLRQLVARFPSPPYDYSIAGHSLGVAISNQLMRDFPFIKMAVGYNGAFQPADLQQQNPNIKRLYTDKDFLYNLGGRIFRNVRIVPMDEEPSKSFFGKIASFFTPSPLKAHQLSNFKKLYGGVWRSEAPPVPKGPNRLATPEEIAKGEFYDYKGRKWYKPLSPEDVAKEKERVANVREQMRVEKIAEYYRQFGGIQGFKDKTMGRQLGPMVATINATGETNPELYGATIKSLVQYFTQFAYLIPDDSVPPATNLNDFYLAFSNINNEALRDKLLGILEQFHQDGYVGTFWLEKRAKREAERQKAFERWRQQHPFEAFINGIAIGLKSFVEGAFLRPLSVIGEAIMKQLPLPPYLGFLKDGATALRVQYEKEALRNERLSGVADPTTMSAVQTGADILNPLSGLSQGLQVGEALTGLLPEQTGQGKIRSIVRKMVDRKKLIDFGEIKWGTLTDLYNRYKRKHPQTSAKTLGEFAHMIVNNPERFSAKATRKARFYVNVIEPKTKGGSQKSGYIASLITGKNKPMELSKFLDQSPAFKEYTLPMLIKDGIVKVESKKSKELAKLLFTEEGRLKSKGDYGISSLVESFLPRGEAVRSKLNDELDELKALAQDDGFYAGFLRYIASLNLPLTKPEKEIIERDELIRRKVIDTLEKELPARVLGEDWKNAIEYDDSDVDYQEYPPDGWTWDDEVDAWRVKRGIKSENAKEVLKRQTEFKKKMEKQLDAVLKEAKVKRGKGNGDDDDDDDDAKPRDIPPKGDDGDDDDDDDDDIGEDVLEETLQNVLGARQRRRVAKALKPPRPAGKPDLNQRALRMAVGLPRLPSRNPLILTPTDDPMTRLWRKLIFGVPEQAPAVPQPAPATFTREVAQASSKPPPPTTPKPSKKASSKPPPPTTPKPPKGRGITFSRKPSARDIIKIFEKREKLVKEIVKLEGDIETARENVATHRLTPVLHRRRRAKLDELEKIGKRLFKIDQDFPEYSDLIERGLRREEVGTAGERMLEGVAPPTPVEPATQLPAGVSEDDIPTAEVIPVSYVNRPTGGKRKFKSKKAGFIASVMTCKNPPARPKFDISKMKEVNEGTRQTNERLVSGDYQWDCPEPINLEEQWRQYLDSLPTARARATARQRLRYWTAGVERDPVSREEALRRAMKLIKD